MAKYQEWRVKIALVVGLITLGVVYLINSLRNDASTTLSQPKTLSSHNTDSICNSYERKLLFSSVQKSILSSWPLKKDFGSFESLKLLKEKTTFGLSLDGNYTRNKIKEMVAKAMSGRNVSVLILGGSPSQGGDLGRRNIQSVYHYAIEGWWNEILGRRTGSYLVRHVVSVGGMGTSYFGPCWREYVSKDEDIDLVIWEFSLNDGDTVQNGKTVERFIRSVMNHPSNPAIIFAQFFKRTQFPGSVKLSNFKTCVEDTEHMKTVKSIAKYYGMSVVNILREVCQYQLTLHNTLTVDEMFINKHPAHLAHAQMAYIIISYLKEVITDYFAESLYSKRIMHNSKVLFSIMPRPIYVQSDHIFPVCWTAVLPHYKKPSCHNLFDLKVSKRSGFIKRSETPWLDAKEIRFDVRGGWKTTKPRSMIEIVIPVNQTDSRKSRALRVVLHSASADTKTKFTLFSGSTKTVKVSNTTTNYLYLGNVKYGVNRLKIETLTGFYFQLAAIIVD